MREHEDCEDAINQALAADKPGLAEFRATRCDIEHGPQEAQARADTEGDADA